MGANDVLLPGNTAAGGLLSERDREQFQKEEISLSPGPKEKIYIQKFYLYMNLTKPSEQLFISWSKVSAEGKTLRPAYLVQDIRRLFPGLRPVDEEKRELMNREVTRKTGMYKVAEGLRDRQRGLDEEWKELYTWFAADDRSREELTQTLKAAFLRKEDFPLGTERASELYPPTAAV